MNSHRSPHRLIVLWLDQASSNRLDLISLRQARPLWRTLAGIIDTAHAAGGAPDLYNPIGPRRSIHMRVDPDQLDRLHDLLRWAGIHPRRGKSPMIRSLIMEAAVPAEPAALEAHIAPRMTTYTLERTTVQVGRLNRRQRHDPTISAHTGAVGRHRRGRSVFHNTKQLDDQAAERLEELSAATGLTKTDVTRRLILQARVVDVQPPGGGSRSAAIIRDETDREPGRGDQ